jgi:hypothetical protein
MIRCVGDVLHRHDRTWDKMAWRNFRQHDSLIWHHLSFEFPGKSKPQAKVIGCIKVYFFLVMWEWELLVGSEIKGSGESRGNVNIRSGRKGVSVEISTRRYIIWKQLTGKRVCDSPAHKTWICNFYPPIDFMWSPVATWLSAVGMVTRASLIWL